MPRASIRVENQPKPLTIGRLETAITAATKALAAMQRPDGHWAFPLEADVTIPAEYVLYTHYLDERDPALEARVAVYLRALQADHGGWPLFPGGEFDVSASVKAYFALKACGDAVDAPHMARARVAILGHGGAERANVFTRTLLALWGQVPWRAVPVMPVEIMLLPPWFPFHLEKISYWSRTVLVPLLVLMALKPRARNPLGLSIAELFTTPPERVRRWHLPRPHGSSLDGVFRGLDGVLRWAEPYFPRGARRRAVARALGFVEERLNGIDGLGAIFPAMVNAVMMLDALGVPTHDPRMVAAKTALRNLVVEEADHAWVQPCLSPVWDTALAGHALCEVGNTLAQKSARRAAEWLGARQITEVAGDWAVRRPGLRPGGWAFQYANPYYPDTDDTAVVVALLERVDVVRYREAVARGLEWVRGMQSENGGWGAFDADNTHLALNHIPFADHGALLDPPTADVTARCVGVLAVLGPMRDEAAGPAVRAGLGFLYRHQEPDGSWFGRWGTNYIYGTWSVLAALNAAGVDTDSQPVRRAVAWLLATQARDGGWGEDGRSYWPGGAHGTATFNTPSQTAWAILGLMAAGEVHHPAVARGVAYLLATRNAQGLWDEPHYTAVGFPRVFYLRYRGYAAFFPLWALARYRNLTSGREVRVVHVL